MPKKRKPKRKHQGKGLKEVLGKIHNFIKGNKLISRGASALAPILPGTYGSVVRGVGSAAANLGYGRKRKGRRKIR